VAHIVSAALLDGAAGSQRSRRRDELLVLPGFDEYMLGYRDRSLMLPAEHAPRIVPGGNGIFMSTIVANGRVIGTWRREVKGKRVEVQAMPFEPLTKAQRQSFTRAITRYAAFLGRELHEVGN